MGTDELLPAGQSIADPDGVQLVQGGVQIVLCLLGEGVSLAVGPGRQGRVGGQRFNRLLHQVVVPALAGLLVIDLLFYGSAGVKGIVGGLVCVKATVVVLHLDGGIVLAVEGQCGEAALKDAAVEKHHDNGSNHHNCGDCGVNSHRTVVLLLLLAALFIALGLLLG